MIKDLKEGSQFKGMLMVSAVSRGVTASGEQYINATLQDSSGQIEAKRWKASEMDIESYVTGNILMITGETYIYKDQLQMKVIESSIVNRDEVNVYDFLAQPVNRNSLLEEFTRFLGLIENEEIKKVVNDLFKDNIMDFSFYPAASKNHHEYVSGLLHHTVGMLKIAEAIATQYDKVNSDYLYAGIMLHDLAKIKELTGPALPRYTLEGKLVGHISIGQGMVSECCKKLNINKEIATVLEHLVLSHHGKHEFGSPVLPSTLEAEIIYLIDNIDSKYNMITKALDEIEEGEFTPHIFPLDNRTFFKPHKTK